MDFPDMQAPYSTRQEAQLGLRYVEQYLENVSYGKLRIEMVPFHGWLRTEHPHEHYFIEAALQVEVDTEVVRQMDPTVDFSEYDLLMTVLPSSHFGGGDAGEVVKTEEGHVFTININGTPLPQRRSGTGSESFWGATAAHELAHKLGLLDFYDYNHLLFQGGPVPPAGKKWAYHQFGLMGLEIYFPAAKRDPSWRDAPEMLAWSRWQLGWLKPHQVKCLPHFRQETTITLSPVANPGRGTAMVAIPLSNASVLVIESRKKVGYDAGKAIPLPNSNQFLMPTLQSEGVLVYTVDAALGTGELPLKIATRTGTIYPNRYPLLAEGQSVTTEGHTITFTSATASTHTITITKTHYP